MFKLGKFIERIWIREVLLFTVLLIVMLINDRDGLINPHKFRDGVFIFFILYLHVQLQRFFVLPYFIAKRYLIFIIATSGVVLAFSFLAWCLDLFLSDVGWYDDFEDDHFVLFLYYLASILITVLLLLMVFIIINYYRLQVVESENRMLIKDMELKLLRSQLDPHFLFNNLNNLYGISLEKPAEVSERIIQMSKILRYQLELSKRQTVTLQEDLEFIRYYIELESERVSEVCDVKFEADYDDDGATSFIAPLILICFIENAFKHFAFPSAGKGIIDLSIRLKDRKLSMHIFNSYHKRKGPHPSSTAIGLENVRQRLELYYPGKYHLVYGPDQVRDDIYRVDFEVDVY